MKLVINTKYGGFGLSDLAYEKLIEYGVPVREVSDTEDSTKPVIYDRTLSEDKSCFGNKRYWDVFFEKSENRSHPLLVKIVEELGTLAASDSLSSLKVIEIPDNISFFIDDYDGSETVRETHRTWS
jgi:hypothetical protein